MGIQVPAQEEHLEAHQAGRPDRLGSSEPGQDLPGEERLNEEEQGRAEEGDAAVSSHGCCFRDAAQVAGSSTLVPGGLLSLRSWPIRRTSRRRFAPDRRCSPARRCPGMRRSLTTKISAIRRIWTRRPTPWRCSTRIRRCEPPRWSNSRRSSPERRSWPCSCSISGLLGRILGVHPPRLCIKNDHNYVE